MKTSDLIFIGIAGTVLALDRVSGEQVWATRLKRHGFVNVILEDETVLACVYGEVFCLDALSGNGKWHNPLKGLGRGLATMATAGSPGSGNRLVVAERHRRDEEEASAAAGAGAS